MKYRVKLKSTVTAWVDVHIESEHAAGLDEQSRREWVADDAVHVESRRVREVLVGLPDGFEFGPIELAHEELDESVQVIG